jgi:hypothetical protein
VNPIPELKPIACKVRTLGWKPTITIRQPGGTLTFTDDQYRPGLFAYGKNHDYCVRFVDGMGTVGKWAEGLLYDGDPDPNRSEAYATVPNATTNQLIRLAEEWETQ